jgi:hypothetical protein
MRLTHSTATARSSSSSSSKSAGDAARFNQPYAGVTHVQCFPMQSPCPCTPLDPPSAVHPHAPAFASACSNGVVRIWRLIPYFYAASGASGGANEGEGVLEDDPVLGEQAVIQVMHSYTATPLILYTMFHVISICLTFFHVRPPSPVESIMTRVLIAFTYTL